MIDLNLDEFDDGAVSHSGWVFADLLIALSVIFLATISFVPAGAGDESAVESKFSAISQVRSQGFSKIYESVDVVQLNRDLTEFRRARGISDSAPLIHLQFVSAAKDEDAGKGILLALEFSIAAKESETLVDSKLTTSLSTSEMLKRGQVLVRAVFGTSN